MTRTRSGGLKRGFTAIPKAEESFEIENILVHKWVSLPDGDIEVSDRPDIAVYAYIF